MKRSNRRELARQTVQIVESGYYQSPDALVVELAETVRACLDATRYYSTEELESIRRQVLNQPVEGIAAVEVVNETTLAGIARVLSDGRGPVAALNFASAKNPGGGFLNGSHAQEESLARSSALYASQCRARDFYERNRASPSLLYSDAMILSPGCPVIRDDDGNLLDAPQLVAFITSAAPNAGAAADTRPEELPLIPDALRRRSEYVLTLAAYHGYKRLVLGAWGCGVFRNDPAMVAETFMSHLNNGRWVSRFERVVFSVLDTSASRRTFLAFQEAAVGHGLFAQGHEESGKKIGAKR